MNFEDASLPKGMVPEKQPSPKPKPEPRENARSEEFNIMGDITAALRDLPFDVEVEEAILYEADSSNETSVKLSLNIFKRPS